MRIDESRITYKCIDPAICKYEVTYTLTYEERFGWIDNLPSLEGVDISDWEYKTAELPETITRFVICPGGEPNIERFIDVIDASIFTYQWAALHRIIEGHKTYIGCYKRAMRKIMRFIDLDEAIAAIRSVLGDSVITEMVCDKLNKLAADDDALLPQYDPDNFEDYEAAAIDGLTRINSDGGDYDE